MTQLWCLVAYCDAVVGSYCDPTTSSYKIGGGLGRVHHYYETRQHNDAPVTCQRLTLGGGLGRVHHYYETRQHNDAPVTYQRLTLTLHSVHYLAPWVWNALPKQIRDVPSISILKKKHTTFHTESIPGGTPPRR